MKKLTLIMVACLVSVASAQKFKDISPAGSPVTIDANKPPADAPVDANRPAADMCPVAVHNTDLRPIMAIVVGFEGTHAQGQPETQHAINDYFFRSDDQIAMKGSDFSMPFPCENFVHPTTTKLLFVQYADGSVWAGNDAAITKEILAQRDDATKYLREALAAPDIKEFTAKQPRSRYWRNSDGVLMTAWNNLRRDINLAADPTAEAKELLSNADEHSAWPAASK